MTRVMKQSIQVKNGLTILHTLLRHIPQGCHMIYSLVPHTAYLSYTMYYVGEFGIVYKAHLVKLGQSIPEVVAVKTLKG